MGPRKLDQQSGGIKKVPDLSIVKNARHFLETLTIDGNRVDWVEFEGGRVVYFDELDDDAAILLAKNLYFTLYATPEPTAH